MCIRDRNFTRGVVALYEEVGRSDKTGCGNAEHQAKADHPENNRAKRKIHQIFQDVYKRQYLDHAPVRLGAKQCPLPFNIGLENAVVPQVGEIVAAARATMYK